MAAPYYFQANIQQIFMRMIYSMFFDELNSKVVKISQNDPCNLFASYLPVSFPNTCEEETNRHAGQVTRGRYNGGSEFLV